MCKYLANRFREVMLSGTWIANSNWQKELSDIHLELAMKKVPNINRIYDLSFHVLYYIKGINQFFQTGNLDIKDSLSFPMVDLKNNEEWQSLKNDLFYQSETLAKSIEEIYDAKLQQDFFDEKYGSYLRNIDGQIEHAYYHLGQIVLLKKMLTYSSVS
ncbi:MULTISPECIES: DUF1572 domain-containing protein [unclassified Sphingobacterium]|uniref:DUF1572 domain-containing protein n=1 Tax=unclassified Sphingobacterium TaxID=2609468 RepID=UPI0020C4A6C2|nr:MULTISPECIES: DUF1572 domain-containing protein [unclassified Sphingobacterium]